ncbi:hypothetical protein [uncultured Eubacterium sp.]|uniref:hypothetical protein n=1 Tax=uncultured Eubacterium sp. TaxID=165185 RepID=UPI002671DC96|nr:hypothetical protein [uncultured Eubacterium sp.]
MNKKITFLILLSILLSINVTVNAKVTTIKVNQKGNYSITLYEGQKCKLPKKALKIIKKSFKRDASNKTWINHCLKQYKNRVFKAKKIAYSCSSNLTYKKRHVRVTIITKKDIRSDIMRLHERLISIYNNLKSFSILSDINFYKDKSYNNYSDFYSFLTDYTVKQEYTKILSKISLVSNINYNNFSVKNKKINKIIKRYNKASAEIKNIQQSLSKWCDYNCIWNNKYVPFSEYYKLPNLYSSILDFENLKNII